jgi:NadR type nicotinamide-nucleotide adenylyltransferase
VKRIVITGPESCGKTTLALQLAKHFKAPLIKEYAREYLNQKKGVYEQDDLLAIAKGQIQQEESILQNFNQEFLFLDTDLITIKIWSQEKYESCDPWIKTQIKERHYDLYLLCKPDLPWTYDPLRENAHNRSKLYKLYETQLYTYKKNFKAVSGLGQARLDNALKIVEDHFHLASI